MDLKTKIERTRNFSIIAHIDHGKSTLADRLMEACGAIDERKMRDQFLDSMDIERERGITIKLNTVHLTYKADDGLEYYLNLIDTPGHVDFSYEVSRSLAACEGALLVVDSTQGVEAQTLANCYLAIDNNLEIIPVINKVDLPSSDPESVKKEIEDFIGLSCENAINASAKTGIGIHDILESVVKNILPPTGEPNRPLRCLIFDSIFDSYRGVIPAFRVVDGTIKKGDDIYLMGSKATYHIDSLFVKTPEEKEVDYLTVGDVGYLCASIKDIKTVHVGDTITLKDNQSNEPLPGYKRMNPMVYTGLYPVDNADYVDLGEALDKLALNDASLIYEKESSQALGFGFRLGFLGLLHMEVVTERIEREFGIPLIATAPSVVFHIFDKKGVMKELDNPQDFPDPGTYDRIEEPFMKTTIMTPEEYVGAVMKVCQDKRGIFKEMEYVGQNRVTIHYSMPLLEIVYDFFDKLKSSTKGYASLDYEYECYRVGQLSKLDILLNGETIDALASIVHKDFAYNRGRAICEKLKDIIPRQLFDIPIQAALGSKVIARTTVKQLRKDVIAKCYGGDVSRKKKLLEKQKEGKKKMKAIGSVEVPQEAFLAVLKLDDEDK
ncbi:MAG: translation elongation factor 4 [Gammaproteobacteria bacterium]|nr:translation elongation factor 4 [Gammaproteobacteria bacterium]